MVGDRKIRGSAGLLPMQHLQSYILSVGRQKLNPTFFSHTAGTVSCQEVPACSPRRAARPPRGLRQAALASLGLLVPVVPLAHDLGFHRRIALRQLPLWPDTFSKRRSSDQSN